MRWLRFQLKTLREATHHLKQSPELSLFINRSATGRRATAASFLVGMQRVDVINGDLFAGTYIAQGVEENMPVDDLHIAVGLARMINVVRAVAAVAAV